MWMTDAEIARSYREAHNRKAQIGVLAELNLCSRAEIEEVLIKTGEIKPKAPVEKAKEDKPKEVKSKGGNKMASIPDCIVQFAYEKLDKIESEIEVYQKSIENLENEYREIVEFLDGRKKTQAN